MTAVAAAAAAMVDEVRVGKAIDALNKWVSCKQQGHIRLLENDEMIYLLVALKRIPAEGRRNPARIVLPHPVMDASSHEICLIVDDKRRDEAKLRVLEEGLRVSKVLGMTKLRNNYSSHEAKRKLCGSYDLFLADKKVATRLPKLLGKVFYRKKKHPILVDLRRKGEWKAQLDYIMKSTFLYTSTGNSCAIKVGRISQSREEIVDNVMAVIDKVSEVIPRKWKNILALHLKSLDSPSLPVYQSSPSVNVTGMDSKPKIQIVKLGGPKVTVEKVEDVSTKMELDDASEEQEVNSDGSEEAEISTQEIKPAGTKSKKLKTKSLLKTKAEKLKKSKSPVAKNVRRSSRKV